MNQNAHCNNCKRHWFMNNSNSDYYDHTEDEKTKIENYVHANTYVDCLYCGFALYAPRDTGIITVIKCTNPVLKPWNIYGIPEGIKRANNER